MLLIRTHPNQPLRLVDKTGRWRSLNFPSGALLGRYRLLDWCLLNSPSSSQSQQPLSWVLTLRASPKSTDAFSSMSADGGRKWVWTEKCHPGCSKGCLGEKVWYWAPHTTAYTQQCTSPTSVGESLFLVSFFFSFQDVPLSLVSKGTWWYIVTLTNILQICFFKPYYNRWEISYLESKRGLMALCYEKLNSREWTCDTE